MLWRLFYHSRLSTYIHGKEPWALVTGASDGIGKCIAEELVKKGFHVLIHGRNPEKLATVRQDIMSRNPGAVVEMVIADVSDVSLVKNIISAAEGKNLTCVVNNVAYQSADNRSVEEFICFSPEELNYGIEAGVRWITLLTRSLLPILIENKPSAMVNVGSHAAENPSPYIVVYAGTKGYVLSFTRSLALELELAGHSDVSLQYQDIHNVATEANGDPANLFTPTPSAMAASMVHCIGKPGSYVTPYWAHEFSCWLLMLMPTRFVSRLTSELLRKRLDFWRKKRS